MKNFIDFHCHILPALDDGAVDLHTSLKMAQSLKAFGFAQLYCTPHLIVGCYETTPSQIREATASLQGALDNEGIGLRLIPGTEHHLTEELMERLDGALTVDTSGYLLVEAPFRYLPEQLRPLTRELFARGLTPLFAHPERCLAFAPLTGVEKLRGSLARIVGLEKGSGEEFFDELYRAGCRFQGNLGSFAGIYGEEVQRRAVGLLRKGVYSCLGSDAHHGDHLELMLQTGYRVVADAVGEEEALALLRGELLKPAGA